MVQGFSLSFPKTARISPISPSLLQCDLTTYQKEVGSNFLKEDIQKIYRWHMKRCSALLSVRVMQIKTTITRTTQNSHHQKKNLHTINAREGVGKMEPSFAVGGNVNWYSYYAEQYGGSLKN